MNDIIVELTDGRKFRFENVTVSYLHERVLSIRHEDEGKKPKFVYFGAGKILYAGDADMIKQAQIIEGEATDGPTDDENDEGTTEIQPEEGDDYGED